MPRKSKTPTGRSAFTLIEILVVIVILMILIALVVGVGIYVRGEARRKTTMTTEAVIESALQAFYDASTPKQFPPVLPTDDTPAKRNAKLYTALMAVPAAKAKLAGLSADANGGTYFKDAFGKEFDYQPTGGLGGQRPVIVSAGSDGSFGYNDANPSTITDDAATKDNIYSDNR